MSTVLLAVKVASAATAIGGIVGGVLLYSNQFNYEIKKPYVIAVQKSTSASETTKYSCKLTDSETIKDDNCVLKKLTLTTGHKRSINSSDLNSSDLWKAVEKNTFKSGNNVYYKVEISDDLGDLKDNSSKTIDIYSKEGSKEKITTLSTLYSVDKNNVVTTKTEYAVGKINKFLKSDGNESTYKQNGPITISETGVKCDFFGENEKTDVTCEIYPFTTDTSSQSEINKLLFSTNTNKQQQISKDKFYLFKLTSNNASTLPKDYLLSTPVKATITPPSSPSEATDIVKLEISDLKPAFFNSTDNTSPIFLYSGTVNR